MQAQPPQHGDCSEGTHCPGAGEGRSGVLAAFVDWRLRQNRFWQHDTLQQRRFSGTQVSGPRPRPHCEQHAPKAARTPLLPSSPCIPPCGGLHAGQAARAPWTTWTRPWTTWTMDSCTVLQNAPPHPVPSIPSIVHGVHAPQASPCRPWPTRSQPRSARQARLRGPPGHHRAHGSSRSVRRC